MSDVDSPDHIFSALEVLSDSADTDYVERDNHRAPTYADDPIFMCSIPDTPSPSDSICSAVIATVASPPLGQPLDLSSGKDDRSKSLKRKSPAETKGRLTGAKISSCDSEEEKHDDSVEDKCIDSQNITTSFAPHATGGSDDPKVGDDSGETMAPPKKQRFDFLDVLMMTSKKLDQRFEDTDILEIAAMKGIHFPPPRWWRPGGYGAEDHQNHANGAGKMKKNSERNDTLTAFINDIATDLGAVDEDQQHLERILCDDCPESCHDDKVLQRTLLSPRCTVMTPRHLFQMLDIEDEWLLPLSDPNAPWVNFLNTSGYSTEEELMEEGTEEET